MQLGTFRNVFNQHWSTESMSYFGNPMEGLQIMGLLETRGLDFKRLIVLGLNEGTMPPTNPIQTLIPMDLRRFFQLPTPREKQGLFAHHFYRLLHLAEAIHITYATAQEGVGSQEPSRFIQQLELELSLENANFQVTKKFYTLGNEELIAGHEVTKTPAVITRLDAMLQEGITFSKLNTFLECPLNFYYRYVLRIGEESKVEEAIESNTLGTILHEVLENLLVPFARTNETYVLNNVVPPPVGLDDWKQMKKDAPVEVEKAFQRHFNEDPSVYASGTNHITYVVANEIIQKVLSREIAECEAHPESTLRIDALEHTIAVETTFELNGKSRPAKIHGVLDRIDQRGGRFRVIDYKSGGVRPEAVSISLGKSGTTEAILKKVYDRNAKNHVLQLLIYCYLFRHGYGKSLDEVGIFSFINTSESPFYLDFKGELSLVEATQLVEEVIQSILQDLYNTEVPFKHRHGAKYCSYCVE
jgi:ATP-dependent helicase/nuclease subunit B